MLIPCGGLQSCGALAAPDHCLQTRHVGNCGLKDKRACCVTAELVCTSCRLESHVSPMACSVMQRTRQAMTHVGIGVAEQDAVFQAVAAVLHLGNLQFEESSEPDSSQLRPGATKHLQAASELLGVNPEGLGKALTTRTRQTVDGELSVAYNCMQHHRQPVLHNLLAEHTDMQVGLALLLLMSYSSFSQSASVPRLNAGPGCARQCCCSWCRVQHPPAATSVAIRGRQPR